MNRKVADIVKVWFDKSEDWQKDIFINLWKGKDIEEIKKRALRLVYKQYGYIESIYKPDVTFPQELQEEFTAKSQILLKSISNIEGVSALNPSQPLEFKDGLNIVYGENGCGKSSYVKILKKAENPKIETKIYSNIFEKKRVLPKATLTFEEDGETKEILWNNNNQKVYPIRIYDTQVAQRFVEKSTEIVYEPKLLHIFTLMAGVYEYLKKEVTVERSNVIEKISIPDKELQTSKTYVKYNSVNSVDKLEEFEKETTFSDEEENEMKRLVEGLSDSAPNLTKKKLCKQVDIINALKENIEYLYTELDESKIIEYLAARKEQIKTRKNFEEFLISVRTVSDIKEFGSEEWKKMWEAANSFQNKIDDYDDSICVLCQQTLTETAKERMKKFKEIYSSKLEKEQEKAHKIFKDKTEKLSSIITEKLNISQIKQSLITNSFEEEFIDFIDTVLKKLLDRANWLYNYNDSNIAIPGVYDVKNFESTVQNFFNEKTENIKSIEKIITNYDEQVKKMNELKCKKWMIDNLNIFKYKKLSFILTEIISSFKTNAITSTKNNLSKVLITDVYIDRFNRILTALTPNHTIKVELVAAGKKGKTLHSIAIKGAMEKSKTNEILSEGEYRVVSIAAFLADLNSINKTQAFVFDDPITSLDHIFEDNVAQQLVNLSMERQVIIFTHRLAFAERLKLFVDKCRDKNQNIDISLNYIELRRSPLGEPMYFGKYDGLTFLNELNKIKDQKIPKIRKLFDDNQYELADSQIASLCSNIRKNIEIGIEKSLINSVVTRYGREVSTRKIRYLKEIQPSDIDLFDEMMEKYSCQEHSQSFEKTEPLPTLEDIEKDMDRLIVWAKEWKKRCKKYN